MSLSFEPIPPVPPETIRVAKAAFPKGNPYLTLRDELEPIFGDADFVSLFSKTGQPAVPPWQLALVTLMQFRANLSDRQTAEAVRSRIDWKYVLGLELTDAGFDLSVLSQNRNNLDPNGFWSGSIRPTSICPLVEAIAAVLVLLLRCLR